MSETRVKLRFTREFEGWLEAENGSAAIGKHAEGKLRPYDLMLGALGACYYATFVGIADKMKLAYDRVEIDIHGVKREEVPTTLKTVDMVLKVAGAADSKGFERASDLAAKYCSVHETIAKVAEISLKVEFVEREDVD